MGRVRIGGSKNAALPILFSGILTGAPCLFYDLPRVSDVLQTLEILRYLGARIRFLQDGAVMVDYSDMRPLTPPPAFTSKIRGSVYLLGSMLGRFGRAGLAGAGGCDFGNRPIDQHLMGFGLLGAEIHESNGVLLLEASALQGADITLAMPSVGATANLLMAATAAGGDTYIRGAAAEPHIAALISFLRSAGAVIEDLPNGDLHVHGGMPLHGASVFVIPDMIEAGTYLAAAMATGGRVRLDHVDPTHLTAVLDTLRQMGASLIVDENSISLEAPDTYTAVSVTTGPYPGFPTDLNPQFAALFCIGDHARGQGSMRELVWQDRFRYIRELRLMGAQALIDGDTAFFTPRPLIGSKVTSPDLRGGAALIIAALAAAGQTEIENAHTVARGYEHIEQKFRALGAELHTVS